MNRRRAVITGVGPVTCIGTGVEQFWHGILAEKSGIGRISTFDSSDFNAHCAGEISVGSPTELPSLLMQGSLKVGSVIPKPKFSSRRVCFKSSPYLRLCRPRVVETSARTPQFNSWRVSFCVAGVSSKGSRLE